MTGAIRRYLFENPSKFDPRDFLKPARAAAQAVCKARFVSFGCEGMAGRLKPVSLDAIATKYKKGELAPIVH